VSGHDFSRAAKGAGSTRTLAPGGSVMKTTSDTIRGESFRQLVKVLLSTRQGTEDWGPIARTTPETCTQKTANRFLLCCLLDYQISSKLAWANGARLTAELGDPENIWAAITSHSLEVWAARFKELHLHRFPAAHNRLWRIGKELCRRYDGDAGKLWSGLGVLEARYRLWDIGAGEQISRMIIGALLDMHHLDGTGDIKADEHLCRVLGRALYGKPVTPNIALESARDLNPSNPWLLDWPLWNVGKSFCHPTKPICDKCSLSPCCVYALEIAAGAKADPD
jgi:endonuclease-3